MAAHSHGALCNVLVIVLTRRPGQGRPGLASLCSPSGRRRRDTCGVHRHRCPHGVRPEPPSLCPFLTFTFFLCPSPGCPSAHHWHQIRDFPRGIDLGDHLKPSGYFQLSRTRRCLTPLTPATWFLLLCLVIPHFCSLCLFPLPFSLPFLPSPAFT